MPKRVKTEQTLDDVTTMLQCQFEALNKTLDRMDFSVNEDTIADPIKALAEPNVNLYDLFAFCALDLEDEPHKDKLLVQWARAVNAVSGRCNAMPISLALRWMEGAKIKALWN